MDLFSIRNECKTSPFLILRLLHNPAFTILLSQSCFHNLSFTIFLSQSFFHNLFFQSLPNLGRIVVPSGTCCCMSCSFGGVSGIFDTKYLNCSPELLLQKPYKITFQTRTQINFLTASRANFTKTRKSFSIFPDYFKSQKIKPRGTDANATFKSFLRTVRQLRLLLSRIL